MLQNFLRKYLGWCPRFEHVPSHAQRTRIPNAWRIAISLCVLITAVSVFQTYSINIPIPGILTPRITTDKEVYRVGDTIHAKFILVNTNGWAVTFSPLDSFSGMHGSFEGESSPVSAWVNVNRVIHSYTVATGEAFNMGSQDFTLLKAGTFTIWSGSASKTVEVIP